MSDRIFDTPAPRLFTLPPQDDFLRKIARQLREEFDVARNPDALTDFLILTPTRRAAKALGDILAEEAGSGVALLPLIRPIGDVDVDDPPFEPGELAGIAPPSISPLRRKFELARLILAKEAALGRPIGVGGALALADPLAALLDDIATEDQADLSKIDEALREHLPEDRREAIQFLDIVQQAWPARLAELGLSDAAARRSLVLRALTVRWTEHPPAHPVLAIGSTGSIPAARDLMAVVAKLPKGAVVLPGFDGDCDDAAWNGIEPDHPQWAMKVFVETLKVADRPGHGVQPWPGVAESEAAGRPRRHLIAEALRPAKTTDAWISRLEKLRERYGQSVVEKGLEGLSLIEAPDPLTEARVCALLLRETLEEPEKTAILVTPDRALARRVSAEMSRFGVRLDDSGGASLAETTAGAFLTRLLDVALDPGSVVALTALWGSPLFTAGSKRGAVHTVLGKFEAEALRGARPGRDFAAVRARLDGRFVELFDADKAFIHDVLDRQERVFEPLLGGGVRSVSDWARLHAEAAENLSAGAEPGLWGGEGGEAAAGLVRALLEESESLPELRLADYAATVKELIGKRRVPPKLGVHPRLQVLGPLEARLITADRVVLAGLNEGVWPNAPGADPWLSRQMRIAAKLGVPEQRYGLAAHDFSQLAAAPDVILTRSARADGAPTVASRWVWRLKTLTEGALGKEAAERALKPAKENYLALAAELDNPGCPPRPAPRPAPAPPVAERPRALSITEIRTWVRDPYSIFARHVLGLRRLDPADMPPGPRERGTALHAALESVVPQWADGIPDTAVEDLVAAARDPLDKLGFTAEEMGVELGRFRRAAAWLVQWEQQRQGIKTRLERVEIKGRMDLEGPHGGFTLTGRADRFDRTADGRLDVIDYKTGSAPSAKAVQAGFDPQLPLTAAMAMRAGVFPDLAEGPPAGLYYVRLPGNAEGGKEARIDSGKDTPDAQAMAEAALDDLERWIARFDDETMPYESQVRAQYKNDYGDFDHLARRGEWASAGQDSDGSESGS